MEGHRIRYFAMQLWRQRRFSLYTFAFIKFLRDSARVARRTVQYLTWFYRSLTSSYLEAIRYEDKEIEAKWGSSIDSIMSLFSCNLFHLTLCHELTLDIYVALPWEQSRGSRRRGLDLVIQERDSSSCAIFIGYSLLNVCSIWRLRIGLTRAEFRDASMSFLFLSIF